MHKWRPISFTLVVDDFGVKYVGKQHAQHLLKILQTNYEKLVVDWDGGRYCGLQLTWNYEQKFVDVQMRGYIEEMMHKYQHPKPKTPQHSPHMHLIPNYGAKTQWVIEPDQE